MTVSFQSLLGTLKEFFNAWTSKVYLILLKKLIFIIAFNVFSVLITSCFYTFSYFTV